MNEFRPELAIVDAPSSAITEAGDYSLLDAEVVHILREAAKRVTGGNCTWVEDDLAILERLAQRAVSAGLTDGLHAFVAAAAKAAALADGEAVVPRPTGQLRDDQQ